MAKPIAFAQQNHTIRGTHLSTEEQPVGDLPAYRDERGVVWSCWELTPEEIEAIKQHGCIFVGLVRPINFPPICVAAPEENQQRYVDESGNPISRNGHA